MTTITPELLRGLQSVWQAIGPDIAEYCGTNMEAIEACVDADRLHPEQRFLEDGGAALAAYRALVAAVGHRAALRLLAAHPQLQLC